MTDIQSQELKKFIREINTFRQKFRGKQLRYPETIRNQAVELIKIHKLSVSKVHLEAKLSFDSLKNWCGYEASPRVKKTKNKKFIKLHVTEGSNRPVSSSQYDVQMGDQLRVKGMQLLDIVTLIKQLGGSHASS